jgi:integrase
MSDSNSTRPAAADKPGKPAKPYPEYPLTPHPAGYWCKKIRGKLHYFGPWSDPDGALAKYNAEKDALHAGRPSQREQDALLVKDVANAFLNAKQEAVDAGELARRTWFDYRAIMDMLVDGMGKRTAAVSLSPQDFAALKNKLAKRNGPARMSTVVQVIRCAFKHAYESGLLDKPMRFGPVFKRTSKKTLRLHRANQGLKLFTREEIHKLLGAAGTAMKAMILLGVNCGFGNTDCGTLPLVAVDLEAGIIDHPRPKTGIPRRCVLWRETVQAIRDVLAHRPEPKRVEDAGLVFLTKYGWGWSKEDNAGPITQEMRKLLNKVGLNGHRNFYTLRHTHRTIADEAKDQPAADYIMGHEVPHMSSVYRETISNERLRAVSDHVHNWLFAPSNLETAPAGQ